MKAYIEEFMQSRSLTTGQLTEKLGYKSKTSLVRIMDGTVRESTLRDFAARMRQSFDLDGAEDRELTRAVQTAIYGEETWNIAVEFGSLIRMRPLKGSTTVMRFTDALTGEPVEMFEDLHGAENIRFTVFNCQNTALAGRIGMLLFREGVRVRHYLRCGDTPRQIIHTVRAVTPAIFDPRYEVLVNTEVSPENTYGLIQRDLFICEYERDGEEHEQTYIFRDTESGVVFRRAGVGFVVKMLMPDDRRYHPVKQVSGTVSLENEADYCAFTQACADMERNRTALIVKPTPCFATIPLEICKEAFNLPASPEMWQTLLAIHAGRVANLRGQHRHTHMVISQGAMRRMIETGLTEDHFWGFRAFTPAERVRWLLFLLQQQRENPWFHIWFLRRDDLTAGMEFTLYEGKGLMMVPRSTHYAPKEGYTEVLISNELVLAHYQGFYFNWLIRESCLNERESTAVLEDLLESAQELAAVSAE